VRKKAFIVILLLAVLLSGCKKKDKGKVEEANDIEQPGNGSEEIEDEPKNEAEKEANMTIEIKLENQKPIYLVDGNKLDENSVLKKGHIIKFVYEGLEGFIAGEGFRTLSETKNLFVVESSGDLSVSVAIKGNLHKFDFRLEGSQSSIELGKFTQDDLILKIDKKDFDIYKGPSYLMDLLPSGKITEHDVDTIDPEVRFFEYEKDGIKFYYYDIPGDNTFNAFVEGLTVESPKHPTSKGLTIGDSYEKMIETYGDYKDKYEDGNHVYYYYYLTDVVDEIRTFSLVFDKQKNKLISYSVFASV